MKPLQCCLPLLGTLVVAQAQRWAIAIDGHSTDAVHQQFYEMKTTAAFTDEEGVGSFRIGILEKGPEAHVNQ
jgi:hypothetical protein